jgi:hypothetical protein
MVITSIPTGILTGATQKTIAGRTVLVEILENTTAGGRSVYKGEILIVSREDFFILRAYGKARLAEDAPEKPPEQPRVPPVLFEPSSGEEKKAKTGKK